LNISVNVPSYKRPKVKTLDYLPFANIWVDQKEYKAYVDANPEGSNIIKCASKHQGNLCRIRNHIMVTEFQNGADVVLIVDDDLKAVGYWERKQKFIIQTDEFLAFLEKYSILAKEWGAYFWGLNIAPDKQNYREYTPFSLSSYIGGPFQCFLKGNECLYDERLYLKEDYDMTLQHLNEYRKVLRLNKFFYEAKQSEQIGGCAVQRNLKVEQEQFELLQMKWGGKIVSRDKSDRSHNRKKVKTRQDYNPVIRVPIKGV